MRDPGCSARSGRFGISRGFGRDSTLDTRHSTFDIRRWARPVECRVAKRPEARVCKRAQRVGALPAPFETIEVTPVAFGGPSRPRIPEHRPDGHFANRRRRALVDVRGLADLLRQLVLRKDDHDHAAQPVSLEELDDVALPEPGGGLDPLSIDLHMTASDRLSGVAPCLE